ncbi:M56 family metallopeptidase [Pedobacter sandarakinus]|uniref:M56 family metallopeptidase n=1 Tax=Pedobacter sandarakinus TaxID=353156 RepID=UPI0022464E8D|nr:M56 family metallopeptidase [Pedobacter sandarakinus]MCX2573294.1 hypothetical protein [Pedobacter sandarakinus]
MELLIYLGKVSICTAVFFCFYQLFLRRLTFFRVNRFYLLSTLLMSFAIPAMQIDIESKSQVEQGLLYATYTGSAYNSKNGMPLATQLEIPIAQKEIDWISLIVYCYIAVALVLLSLSVGKLLQLLSYARKYSEHKYGIQIVHKNLGFTNCSFFNYVFIDEAHLAEKDLHVLLTHEKVHASQLHSVDKLLLMFAKTILWINPFIYLIDRYLEQLHEYEADAETSSAFGKKTYANVLLRVATAKTSFSLMHHLAKSPLKERIEMLFGEKSNRVNQLRYLWNIPLVLIVFCYISINIVEAHDIELKRLIAPADSLQVFVQKKVPQAVLRDSSPKRSAEPNSNVKQYAIKPKIISYRNLKGNTKSATYDLVGATIEVNGGILSGERIIYSEKEKLIVAKGASFEKNGITEEADEFRFDLSKQTYSRYSNKEINLTQDTAANSKVVYTADSVKFSKGNKIVTLYGDARITFKNINLSGSKIIFDSSSNMITVVNAQMRASDGKTLIADSVFVDLKDQRFRYHSSR